MNALSSEQVGNYLATHFISAFQKVGTFRIEAGQKQGGNVASYFVTGQGQVLHVLGGPVEAATFLREARTGLTLDERGDIRELDAKTWHERRERLEKLGGPPVID